MAKLGFVRCSKKPHTGWFVNGWTLRECEDFKTGDDKLVPDRVAYFKRLNKAP